MWNRSRTLAAFGLVLAATFVAGLAQLLAMRAETGAFYPPYSTFRADPLGSRAFYEGLATLPDIHVDRNLAPLSTLGEHRDSTCLFLGDSPEDELPESLFETIETIPARGGRLVIAFAPQAQEGFWQEVARETKEEREKREQESKEKKAEDEEAKAESAPSEADEEAEMLESETEESSAPQEAEEAATPETDAKPDESATEDEDTEEEEELSREYGRSYSLQERWGIGIGYTSLKPDGEGGYTPLPAVRNAENERLPENLAWHSAMYFKELSDAWRTVYSAEERPVVVERDFGTGTIVFISDSFPFSNEALRTARHPGLLTWVVGPNRRVVFDETHLGIREQSGVMVLARQYRMHGLFIGLVILALLYVWQSTSPLTPRYEARGEGDVVAQVPGRDAVSGLANLLKRSIPQREVLSVCLAEWRQAFGRSPRNREKLRAAEAMVQRSPELMRGGEHAVETYKEISAALSKRGR